MVDTAESAPNAQQRLLEELLVFFDPVVRAAQDPDEAYGLIRATGWTPEALLGSSGAALLSAITTTASAVQVVEQSLATPPQSLADLDAALSQVGAAANALQALPAAMGTGRPPELDQLPGDLLEVLGLMYLQRRAESLVPILRALTIIHTDSIDPVQNEVGLVREGGFRERLDLARIPALLSDPVGELKNHYLPTSLTNAAAADAAAARLLPPVADVFRALGADAVVGRGDSPPQAFPSQEAILARTMTAIWQSPVESEDGDGAVGVELGLGFTLRLMAADEGGPGLLLSPFGQAALVLALTEAWQLTLGATATVDAALITRHGVQVPSSPAGPARIGLDSSIEKLGPDGAPAVRVGSVDGTRLEIGRLRLTASSAFDAQQQSFGLLLEATSGALVIAAGDGDGFLQQILPKEGLRTEIDLALGWSSERGLYFRGGAGLEAILPVHRDIGGVLKIHTVALGLRADSAGLRAHAATAISVQLGPISASVEGMGVLATLSFPPDGGNVGVAELHLRFKPPTGVGLAIDAGVVVGGGFLLFDPEKGQYAGAVQLELAETIELTAFGLLSTRMPDGSPGFSLLILMSATFSPSVQLGYGFTLSGVGGLIGVNRTVAVDTLRAGLRNGALGSVLFPTDPIRNAPQIVSDLQAIFPPAKGRFLFGPMVQLGWGTPTLVTIELGLILELPAPVRLLILGRLRVLLPDERLPVVRLQLDAVGVIDFASGDVSLDAVLYDSQIAQFAVTGAMAMRANFGAKPNFVLAIGGFNPRFPAPAGFPALERVAISLATGDNPRLRLEAYLALTTNTVQFGAHLELYAQAGPFSIDGLLGFDVLMQLVPFGFIAEMGANLALKHNGSSVMSVALNMTLTGPNPWRARGTASFTVLFISGSIAFDVRVGAEDQQALPPPVDVRALLEAALSDEDNWTTQVPQGQHPLVSLRERPGSTEQLVHPLADLRVKQRIAPLGREISRFGGAEPKGERVFSLSVSGPDGRLRSTPADGVEPVMDLFAPAQFRDMNDDEKLTAPAFEPMQAGISFVSTAYVSGKAVIEGDITFARKTIYRPGQAASTELARTMAPNGAEVAAELSGAGADGFEDVSMPADLVRQVAAVGSAAQAPIAHTGASRYQTPVAGVTLGAPRYAVVAGHGLNATVVTTTVATVAPRPAIGGPAALRPTLAPEVETSVLTSYTQAVEALHTRLQDRPVERGRLRVVPMYTELDR